MKTQKVIPIEKKKEILEYAKKTTQKIAAKKYRVHPVTVARWSANAKLSNQTKDALRSRESQINENNFDEAIKIINRLIGDENLQKKVINFFKD